MKKNILFIHQNFPGQFRHIIQYLAKRDDVNLLGIGLDTAPGMGTLIPQIKYKLHRAPTPQTHPYARSFEQAVLYGQQVLKELLKLKQQGYRPDVIISHPGWGETLFAKEAFPQAKLIHFCEFYYHLEGADVGFDPEYTMTDIDEQARIKMRNGLHLLNLENCDIAITPTKWQHSLHPKAYHDKLHIIHEGIDTELLKPNPTVELKFKSGVTLKKGDLVITYVARNLEPYRGFHIFMRAIPQLLKQNPSAHVIIVGGNDVSYGSKPKDAPNWKTKLLQENPISPKDFNRIHFLGKVPYLDYLKILQISSVHVYLTYPFVLSWSCLEAMATGCLMIGSNTPPVQEVITHHQNGILVDFFDINALTHQITEALNNQNNYKYFREQARTTVQHYSIEKGNQAYQKLILS